MGRTISRAARLTTEELTGIPVREIPPAEGRLRVYCCTCDAPKIKGQRCQVCYPHQANKEVGR